jgi:hypothetical protein
VIDTLELFEELPILAELEAALTHGFDREEAAAAPPPRRPRLRMGLLLPAAAAFVLLGGGAAAATLLVLRGSVIPGPTPTNVQPQMTPLVRTLHVEPVRAADPAGGAPWGVRIAHSETGLLCTAAGQIVGGRFGIVGLDGRFRTLAPTFADGCGAEVRDRASLVGARVFYSPKLSRVRTVIDGIAGPGLKSVVLQQVYRPDRRLTVSPDGAFVGVVSGYPEDVGARVVLTFRDGHSEDHSLGRSPFVTPDPAGGRAWRVQAFQLGNAPPGPVCVSFESARQVEPLITGPPVCGSFGDDHYFFAVRHFEPGESRRGGFESFSWHRHPPRTVVWGSAGKKVKSVTVDGPGGPRSLPIALGRTFLAIYPGNVKPSQLTVVVRLGDGSVQRRQGSANTRPFPRPRHS